MLKQTSCAVNATPSVKKVSDLKFQVQVVWPMTGVFVAAPWLVVNQSKQCAVPPGCVWHSPPVFGSTASKES
jgi:hypothetical protein